MRAGARRAHASAQCARAPPVAGRLAASTPLNSTQRAAALDSHRRSCAAILSSARNTTRLSWLLKPPETLPGLTSPVTTTSTSLSHVDSPLTNEPKGCTLTRALPSNARRVALATLQEEWGGAGGSAGQERQRQQASAAAGEVRTRLCACVAAAAAAAHCRPRCRHSRARVLGTLLAHHWMTWRFSAASAAVGTTWRTNSRML